MNQQPQLSRTPGVIVDVAVTLRANGNAVLRVQQRVDTRSPCPHERLMQILASVPQPSPPADRSDVAADFTPWTHAKLLLHERSPEYVHGHALVADALHGRLPAQRCPLHGSSPYGS